jgi:transposase
MKIHVIVDEGSKPIAAAISPGNIHDSKMFNPVYDKMKIGLKGFMGIRHTVRMR